MMSWNYIVPLAGLLLLIVLFTAEVRRANKQRLPARLLATLVSIVCIVLLALPLYLPEKNITAAKSTTDTTTRPPVQGIIACNWPRQLPAGQEWPVQGVYNNQSSKPVQLRMAGFDTDMDSVIIPARQQQAFSLKTIPLHKGRAVYRIIALSGKDTLEQQPLPLEVTALTSMNILFLASSPDFDNRFLADWLVQQGNGVAMRTLVSGSKYATRFSNFPQQPLDQLTPSLLDKFDVVIAAPAAIPKTARNWLEQHGTGLILKGDTAGGHPHPLALFLQPQQRLPSLHTDPVVALPTGNGITALVTDSLHHAYVTVSLAGEGKLVRTQLLNTYSWLLQGHTTAYQQYWSALLNEAARKKITGEKISVRSTLPRRRDPVEVTLETAATPALKAGNIQMYLRRHPFLPQQWSGTWWPDKTGWQLLTAAGSQQWQYIFDVEDWKSLAVPENRPAQFRMASQPGTARRAVSPGWFIIPLLIAMGFLWWEKKM